MVCFYGSSWPTPTISTLGRLRQENLKFKASLGYRVELYFTKKYGLVSID